MKNSQKIISRAAAFEMANRLRENVKAANQKFGNTDATSLKIVPIRAFTCDESCLIRWQLPSDRTHNLDPRYYAAKRAFLGTIRH